MAKNEDTSDQSKSLTIIDSSDPQVVEAKTHGANAIATANGIVIDSNEMYEIADAALQDISGRIKELERRKGTVMDPLNAAVKAMRALFKGPEEALDSAKATLRTKMAAYQSLLRQRTIEAEKAAAAERERALKAADDAAAKAVEDLSSGAITEAEYVQRADSAEAAATAAAVSTFVAPVDRPSSVASSASMVWTCDVVNLPAVLRFIADSVDANDHRFLDAVTIKVKPFLDAARQNANFTAPGVKLEKKPSIRS